MATTPKKTKKKTVSPSSIPGWDEMSPIQRSRALALANSIDDAGRVIPASDFDSNLQMIHVPDICYQWALGRPGYATGRIQVLMGYEGSSKTSKQFALANWTMQQGGIARAVFVEHADSTFHMKQYISEDMMPYFMCHVCDTLEEAIAESYRILNEYEQIDPENKVKKFLLFDSVAGATQEKLLEDESEPGAPKPGGIGAIMSDFVNAMKTRIHNTNTLWAVNNQGKDQIPTGFAARVPMSEDEKMIGKGGRALPFHATYQERVKRAGQIKGDTDVGRVMEGFEVKLKFRKNKLGVPGREISYNVEWGKGIQFVPHTMAFLSAGRVCGMMDQAGAGSRPKTYYSKEMGISKASALNAEEMYAAVHSPEYLPMFQRELDVITDISGSSGRDPVPVLSECHEAQEEPPPPPQ